MTRYVILLNFTDKGVAAFKDSLARAEAFRQRVAQQGAKVEALYWTLGSYDGLLILSAPDETTAAALVLGLGSKDYVRTTMLRAFDAEQFQAIVARTA